MPSKSPSTNGSVTYRDAGVDIDAGNDLVRIIKPLAKSPSRAGADVDLGGFGGLFDLKRAGFKDPILVSSNDGVGTKLKIAIETGKHGGGRARAHLRYVQRDGTSRDGERGRLYSATEDRADGDAFLDRGKDDRHQFRFIVSPEDSAELSDLTAYTRDFMKQVEADLGTKLDWVAVNHYNTGHPHVHVIVRGKDHLGENLVINGDYLANGIRERASELTTLELGPVTEIEQSRKLSAEIDQDRFTRIDRAMMEEADERFLDLRHEPAERRRRFERTLRLRRLTKLEKMGLATEHAPAVWELSKDMEPAV